MLKAWTPFETATLIKLPIEEHEREVRRLAQLFSVSEEIIERQFKDLEEDMILKNSRYQVNVRKFPPLPERGWPELIHLSIKRLDKQRVGEEHYRDFLRIKNEIVGEEHEAVELYPRSSRNVDTSNQYHLWCLIDPTLSFPFGFRHGKMIGDVSGSNAQQHPFDKD